MPLYDRTYSEEADEIIGTMPSWIVRWGITLIFVLLALLFLGCYFIRYPQTVTGTITLTTVPPPVDVTAPPYRHRRGGRDRGPDRRKGRRARSLRHTGRVPRGAAFGKEPVAADRRDPARRSALLICRLPRQRQRGDPATAHVGDRSVEGAARRRGSGRRACDTAQQRSVPTSDDSRRVAGEHPARGRDGGRRPASSAGPRHAGTWSRGRRST